MSGWRRKLNWNHRLRLKVLALALVSAAVFAGPASAKPSEVAQFKLNTSGTDPYLQDSRQVESEQTYLTSKSTELSPGGVTPTNLARAYTPRSEGVASSVGGRSFELGDAALGFGLALLLATGCAVAIVRSRRGMRMAHS